VESSEEVDMAEAFLLRSARESGVELSGDDGWPGSITVIRSNFSIVHLVRLPGSASPLSLKNTALLSFFPRTLWRKNQNTESNADFVRWGMRHVCMMSQLRGISNVEE